VEGGVAVFLYHGYVRCVKFCFYIINLPEEIDRYTKKSFPAHTLLSFSLSLTPSVYSLYVWRVTVAPDYAQWRARAHTHTHIHVRTSLDEVSDRRRDVAFTTFTRDILAPGEIRTLSPSQRATANRAACPHTGKLCLADQCTILHKCRPST
jgi:hypothetical protein